MISSITDSYISNTSIKTHEVSLSNGSRIIALPANPDTARSYEGDVTLDEFGFHIDARRIYEAIVKGETAMEPGLPESFNVLVRELQSLCLDVELRSEPN